MEIMTPSAPSLAVSRAQEEFSAEVVYLNTASLGLPPRRGLAAVQDALDQWRAGRANPPDYDEPLAQSRASFAAMVCVEPSRVAVGSQVSVFAGLLAASLPSGAEVLVAAGEFTSMVFPFLAQRARGVRVREVELGQIADAVTPRTTLVAASAVQSADGRVTDLDALAAASSATGAKVLLDTTQAVGWLPVDAGGFAYTVCGGDKWLLAPRGTCFFTIQGGRGGELLPHSAGWYAGAFPWDSIYGGPLRLAADARRFDVSPAWLSWVGQAPALELLTAVGTPALHEHALGLANRFRAAVGLPTANSAIVSLPLEADAGKRLRRADVTASVRAGRLRLAFHLNNTADDVE